ncbi:hypothetical protein DWB84_04345 [Saccharophagus sp. K07]|nr:hypothetical protein [Saccharophagus sp. K07]
MNRATRKPAMVWIRSMNFYHLVFKCHDTAQARAINVSLARTRAS